MHRRVASRPAAPSAGSLRAAALFALVTGAYVGAAKLGIDLSVSHGVITPVWAPSGIALAALLLLGLRYWPAVALGAFMANVTSDASVAVAAGIAVGNTLEAVVGATLVRRIGFRPELDRVRAVLALVGGGALVSTAISATNGVAVLSLAGARDDSWGVAWLLWWFGDAVGELMVAPVILVLATLRRRRPSLSQLAEVVALVIAVAGVSALVFLGGAWRYPYLIFPLLLWAALRFRQTGAAVGAFLVGAIGTWGAVAGTIPIGAASATERVQIVQALFALVAVSLLVVGATLSERAAESEALARAADSLSEAQAITHIGSWEWDVAGDVVTWSDELYRVFGLAAGRPVSYASYLELIHPDDRTLVEGTVAGALEDRRPFAFEHRIVRPDGAERIIASRGRVHVEDGEPRRMLGTAQDVTEHRKAERLREDMLAAVSHELRTPLTTILGFALTLQERGRELPTAVVRQGVGEIVAAAERLDRLLADLLDVERARRGFSRVTRRRTEIGELVERVAEAVPLDGRRLSIALDAVVADVDAQKLERIVENLLLNAAKHTPPGSTIDLRVQTAGRDLVVAVDDDGPGVADEFKNVIFETFNRGPSMLSVTSGAGIGLSLVAQLAAVHGGRAWVEDRPGGGASFRVLLPDCAVPEPEEQAAPEVTGV